MLCASISLFSRNEPIAGNLLQARTASSSQNLSRLHVPRCHMNLHMKLKHVVSYGQLLSVSTPKIPNISLVVASAACIGRAPFRSK